MNRMCYTPPSSFCTLSASIRLLIYIFPNKYISTMWVCVFSAVEVHFIKVILSCYDLMESSARTCKNEILALSNLRDSSPNGKFYFTYYDKEISTAVWINLFFVSNTFRSLIIYFQLISRFLKFIVIFYFSVF